MDILREDKDDYEFSLIGFFWKDSNNIKFYTIIAINGQDFPIIVNDKIVFFSDLKLAGDAVSKAQDVMRTIDSLPEEIDYNYDFEDILFAIDKNNKDDGSSILNCINIFDDLLIALNIPLPQKYKKILYPIADFLTFDTRLLVALDQQNVSRKTFKEAVEWCIDSVFSNSKILAAGGEFALVDWIKDQEEKNKVQPETTLEEFMAAAEEGNIKEIQRLIGEGIDIDSKDEDGFTAIHWAAQEGFEEVTKILIQKGADINSQDEEGSPPLEVACLYNHFGIVKLLFNHNVDITINNDGYTALHAAATASNPKMIEFLLDAGFDVNARDNNGTDWAPLHWAAEEGYAKAVKLLVKRGADIYSRNLEGFTPLHLVSRNGYLDLVEFFVIECNFQNLDVPLPDGTTPLHLACMNQNKEVVELLVQKGANVHLSDKENKNSLHYAAKSAYSELIEFILAQGVDVLQKDIHGKSPSDYVPRACGNAIKQLEVAQKTGTVAESDQKV